MNEVAGHTVKVGQGEVKSCNQLQSPAGCDSFEERCDSDLGPGVEPRCIFKAVWYCAPEKFERERNSAKYSFLCRQQKILSAFAVVGNTILQYQRLCLGKMHVQVPLLQEA